MKSAVHTGEREITVKEADVPSPGPGEYLVKIKACSICGSDTWWKNKPPSPGGVHGHESAGVIEARGEGAEKFSVGDRVVCYAILGCGACRNCEAGNPTLCAAMKFVEGGFQEYSVFSESLLFPCPDDSDFITASLLSDAVGVPLRGMRRLPPATSDSVCVWGLGPLGLLQVMFLKARGVKTVIGLDPVDERRRKAEESGADHTINPLGEDFGQAAEKICGGADKAYTYVRSPEAAESIFKSVRGGGSICTFVGLQGEYNLPEFYERSLVWSFYFTPGEYAENVEFVRDSGIDLKSVVSDVYPLEEINEAFRKRFEEPEKSLKIVITTEV